MFDPFVNGEILLRFWKDSTLAENCIYNCDYSRDEFEARLYFVHVAFACEHRNTNALTWESTSQDILL